MGQCQQQHQPAQKEGEFTTTIFDTENLHEELVLIAFALLQIEILDYAQLTGG